MTPIFLDANVPMYAVGRDHAQRSPSRAVLTLVANNESLFFTNAEVLQEILHRYKAVGRISAAVILIDRFSRLMKSRIEPLIDEDVELASKLAGRYPVLSARDLVHTAIMQRVGASQVVSADSGFDSVEGIQRLNPMRVAEWRERVVSRQQKDR